MARASSPSIAAALSLLVPGLGQAYAGRPGRGVLLALPVLVLAGLFVALAAGGWRSVLGLALQPAWVRAMLLLGPLLLAYHAAVIVDAHRVAGRGRVATGGGRMAAPSAARARTSGSVPMLVVVLALALVAHAVPWYVGYRAAPNLAALFHEGSEADWVVPSPSWATSPDASAAAAGTTAAPGSSAGGGPTPSATAVPGSPAPGQGATPPAATAMPSATPFAGAEWARDGQLNIVLLGSDEGPGRWSLRTDAIFLLSIEIETARAALFGFPRYMSSIPMPPESAVYFRDGRFPGYVNALYVAAQNNPRRYPGNDARGLRVVAGAVQEMAGVTVDHYVMANLNGFVQLIEAVGGLWVDVPEPGVTDDKYTHQRGFGHIRLRLRPGCQLLDGTRALAFARSRHQDSDYARMGRQVVALQALRRQFDPLAVAPRAPEMFDIAGENIFWTLQPADVAPIAELVARVDADRVQSVLFIPPEYKRELNDERIEAMRATVRGIFAAPEPDPPAGSTAADCPP